MNDNINSVDGKICPYCLTVYHLGAVCPKVKAFEYYPDGNLKRVEFKDNDNSNN